MKIQAMFVVIAMSLICSAVEVDFSGGGYKIKSDERKDKEKYERREPKEVAEDFERKRLEAKEKADQRRLKSEYEKSLISRPFRKIVFYDGGVVTNDFINTTSNRLMITVVDWEKAELDGIEKRDAISKNCLLNLMLLPGDKYLEMNDGGNGMRLPMYLQAKKLCKEANDNLRGEKFRYLLNKYDGLTLMDVHRQYDLDIKLEDSVKKISFVPVWHDGDKDSDGIKDFDEINGVNGFVTDPTDPDTDRDGIPDKKDKDPLVKCRSQAPDLMPYEWAEYRSKGDAGKIELLLPANADPDNDGLTNEQEKILHTDPLVKNEEKLIVFPKKQCVKPKGSGTVNVYLNCDFPAVLKVWTVDAPMGTSNPYPTVYESDITPLGWKPSPFTKLFNKRRTRSKTGYFITADVQPKTIYSFTVNALDNRYDVFVNVAAYKSDEYRDGKSVGRIGNERLCLDKYRDYSPWMDSDFWPDVPELISPRNDGTFTNLSTLVFKYADFPEKYKEWKKFSIYVTKFPKFTPCGPTSYAYDIKDFKKEFSTQNFCLTNNYDSSEIDKLKKFNDAETLLCYIMFCDPFFCCVHALRSETRVIFKENRIRKDHPFVFEGSTVKTIKEEIVKKGYTDEQLITWE